MKNKCLLIISFIVLWGFNSFAQIDTLWVDAKRFGIEGKGWTDMKNPFDRLPSRAEYIVDPAIWKLSHHTAGMSIKFISNSPEVFLKWSLLNSGLAMSHMPSTGVSGLDLYVKVDGQYYFLGNAKPGGQFNNFAAFKNYINSYNHYEYTIYLPLYNGIEDLQIGVPTGYAFLKNNLFNEQSLNPIVFYGTSITQGACASRPGLCFTALLERKLDVPVINLGFSGNGNMDDRMMDLITELNPSAFILDCHRNMTIEQIKTRFEKGIKKLRLKHLDTPIIILEDSEVKGDFPTVKGKLTREIYTRLIKQGFKYLHYINGDDLLSNDTEGTVDMIHPNDLGFYRYANTLEPILRQILFN